MFSFQFALSFWVSADNSCFLQTLLFLHICHKGVCNILFYLLNLFYLLTLVCIHFWIEFVTFLSPFEVYDSKDSCFSFIPVHSEQAQGGQPYTGLCCLRTKDQQAPVGSQVVCAALRSTCFQWLNSVPCVAKQPRVIYLWVAVFQCNLKKSSSFSV